MSFVDFLNINENNNDLDLNKLRHYYFSIDDDEVRPVVYIIHEYCTKKKIPHVLFNYGEYGDIIISGRKVGSITVSYPDENNFKGVRNETYSTESLSRSDYEILKRDARSIDNYKIFTRQDKNIAKSLKYAVGLSW